MIVSLVAQLILVMVEQEKVGIAMMALIGFSWPGKMIVGLVYASEFFCRNQKKYLIFSFFLTNAAILCIIPNFYEYINRDWYPLQALGLILGTASLCYCILFMPESLWTYYQKREYHTQRITMEGLLKMNGFSDTRLIFRFKDESVDQYNRAIYNLTGGNDSNSTNFETGSN